MRKRWWFPWTSESPRVETSPTIPVGKTHDVDASKGSGENDALPTSPDPPPPRGLSFMFRRGGSAKQHGYAVLPPENATLPEENLDASEGFESNNALPTSSDPLPSRGPFFLFRRGSSAQQHEYAALPEANATLEEEARFLRHGEENEDDVKSTKRTRGDSPTIDEEYATCDEEFESLLPEDEAFLEDGVLVLWRRRRQHENERALRRPLQSLVGRARGRSANKGSGSSEPSWSDPQRHAGSVPIRMEAGGGCNEENLRALELRSHLRASKRSGGMSDMEVMLSREKEEDLRYDLFVRNLCELDMEEEPEFGYDNLGWYQTLANSDDGEDDEADGRGETSDEGNGSIAAGYEDRYECYSNDIGDWSRRRRIIGRL